MKRVLLLVLLAVTTAQMREALPREALPLAAMVEMTEGSTFEWVDEDIPSLFSPPQMSNSPDADDFVLVPLKATTTIAEAKSYLAKNNLTPATIFDLLYYDKRHRDHDYNNQPLLALGSAEEWDYSRLPKAWVIPLATLMSCVNSLVVYYHHPGERWPAGVHILAYRRKR